MNEVEQIYWRAMQFRNAKFERSKSALFIDFKKVQNIFKNNSEVSLSGAFVKLTVR